MNSNTEHVPYRFPLDLADSINRWYSPLASLRSSVTSSITIEWWNMKRSLTFDKGTMASGDGRLSCLKRSKSFANLARLCCEKENVGYCKPNEQEPASRCRASSPCSANRGNMFYKVESNSVSDFCESRIAEGWPRSMSTESTTVESVPEEELSSHVYPDWCCNLDGDSEDGDFSIGGFCDESEDFGSEDSEPESHVEGRESYRCEAKFDRGENGQDGVWVYDADASQPPFENSPPSPSLSQSSFFLLRLQRQFEDMRLAQPNGDGVQLAVASF